MSKVLVRNTGWNNPLKSVSQVISHAKYIGFRSKEITEKGFFGRDDNKVDYKEFIKRLENNRALKHSRTVKVHKLLFSLKEIDYNAYKRSGKDYKDIVRATLNEYEQKHGVNLDWIANIHEKEGHPHCHVIIKAVSDIKDANGRYSRIYFKKEDYKEFRESFDKQFFKDVQYTREELGKTLLDDKAQDEIMKEVGRGFERVLYHVKHEAEKEKLKAEHARDKMAKDAARDNSRDRDR